MKKNPKSVIFDKADMEKYGRGPVTILEEANRTEAFFIRARQVASAKGKSYEGTVTIHGKKYHANLYFGEFGQIEIGRLIPV